MKFFLIYVEFNQLPLDLSTLSEAERKARLDKRKPRQKIRVEEELEDSFNSNKYLNYIKKWSRIET